MQLHHKIIDLEQLRCFVVAAHSKSFQQAAKQIAISPQAFGERIRQLESQLETKLFVRNTRSVHLSQTGQKLIEHARRLLEMSALSFEMVHSKDQGPVHIKLGTRWELGLSWLQPILDRLEDGNQNYQFDLTFASAPELLKLCKSGEIDACISSHRLNQTTFDFIQLHEEAYVFVGHKELLKKQKLKQPLDAEHHFLLDIQQDLPLFRYFIDGRDSKETWRFKRVQQLGTIEAIKRSVLKQRGVAVLPLYFIQEALKQGSLEVLFPKSKLPSDYFRLIWRQGHPQEQDLKLLADELKKYPLQE